jgi:hypothetical protein
MGGMYASSSETARAFDNGDFFPIHGTCSPTKAQAPGAPADNNDIVVCGVRVDGWHRGEESGQTAKTSGDAGRREWRQLEQLSAASATDSL